MPYDVFIGCPEEGEAPQSEEAYARLDTAQVRQLVDQQPDLTFMQHDENVAGDKRLRVFLLRNNKAESRRVDNTPHGVPPEMLPQVTEALRDVLTMMERKAGEFGVGFAPTTEGHVRPPYQQPAARPEADIQPRRAAPVRIHIFSGPLPEEPQTVHHFGVPSKTTGRELVSASKQIRRLRTRQERVRRVLQARTRRQRDGKFERLRVALARQLETESFFRARLTVCRMLRLRPRHNEARMARAFLKQQMGFSSFAAAVVMFFPDLIYVVKEELARVGRTLMMPFTGWRRLS